MDFVPGKRVVMAKHSKACRQSNQARKQRKLKPMPLTRKVEQLTQTGTWVYKYKKFIMERMSTDNGSTSLLPRRTFCDELDLLMAFNVNQVVLLTSLHRMVNTRRIEGTTFYTYASLAPVLNEILYIELSKLGPIEALSQKVNWNRLRKTMQ